MALPTPPALPRRHPAPRILAAQIPTVLFGETADLNVARVGGGSGGAWHIVPLHIRVDGSGGAFFYALRAALPAGDYVGIVRVTGKDGAARWLPIPIAGLATVDNGCGDGGRNSLFSVAK